ncbi:hypothetical protein LRS06_15690 [Hymenobacter sp. J193]|nr:hypothetical protein [Hymenobacter sp. J193]MCR5889180.1 hypothetical protein [Hymenobacter sp. J193]
MPGYYPANLRQNICAPGIKRSAGLQLDEQAGCLEIGREQLLLQRGQAAQVLSHLSFGGAGRKQRVRLGRQPPPGNSSGARPQHGGYVGQGGQLLAESGQAAQVGRPQQTHGVVHYQRHYLVVAEAGLVVAVGAQGRVTFQKPHRQAIVDLHRRVHAGGQRHHQRRHQGQQPETETVDEINHKR